MTPKQPPQQPQPVASWREPVGLAGRVLVAGILLFSGIHKAAAPAEEFVVVLENYALLPEVYLPLFARLVPWAEVFGGMFLLAGLWTRAAAALTALLSLSFFTALLLTKLRGIELPNCGCFGQSLHLERWQAMLVDTVMMAFSVAAWRWGRRKASLDNWAEAAAP